MPHNILYNYLSTDTEIQRVLTRKLRLVKDTNAENIAYYRLELDPQQLKDAIISDGITDLHIIDCHGSIYNNESSSNPKLSQYHVTILMHDKDSGKKYRAHIYYKGNDELASEPVVSIQERKSYKTVSFSEFNEDLLVVSSQIVFQFIPILRAGLVNKVSTLIADVEQQQHDAEALSVQLDQNRGPYVTALENIIATLNVLSPLVKHRHYQQVGRFLQQMKQALIAQANPPKAPALAAEAATIKPLKKASIETPVVERQMKSQMPNTYATDIANLHARYLALSTAKIEEYAERLGNLQSELTGLLLIMEDSPDILPMAVLQQLNELNQQLPCKGQERLRHTLKNKDFKSAEFLRHFNYALTEEDLQKALVENDHEILEYLLKLGTFEINTLPITVADKSYSSAIEFCYETHTVAKPTTACLKVLIMQNASLHVPDSNGLPIAYKILLPNSPFEKAIKSDKELREKTIDSIAFYSELIAELTLYLRQQPKIKHSQKEKIEKFIADSRNKRETLRQAMRPGRAVSHSFNQRTLEVDTRQGIHPILEEVDKDPEVIALKAKERNTYIECLNSLKGAQKRAFSVKTKVTTRLNINPTELGWDFDVAKKKTIEHYRDSIEYLDNYKLQAELVETAATYQNRKVPPEIVRAIRKSEENVNRLAREEIEKKQQIQSLAGSTSPFDKSLTLFGQVKEDASTQSSVASTVQKKT